MNGRTLTIVLALTALALAGVLAYLRQDIIPLLMALPLAAILLINSGRPAKN